MPKVVASPLHEQVRKKITRRVVENEYKVGELLPSVSALADEFGVSSITIKRALRDLQSTGILRTVPGLGIFVRERRRLVRELDFCFTSLGEAQRPGPGRPVHVTSITRERILDPAFSAFDAPTGTMLCVRSILSIDEVPILFDTSYLPLSLKDKVVDEFGDKLVSEALRDQGTCFRMTRLLIDAAPASDEAQQAFGIPNGYPTLRRLYHLIAVDPFFSVFGIVESPFDRLACSIEMDLPTGKITGPRSTGSMNHS
ncbi:GntR family transcriptional regulator [Mesorhizobium sp.]|uniref:GntR family transcriptional regulator n=1 Tax=Mesorhizobium sp. TaxID=1871066 RepID=UPI000FD3923F|nr:GntR family transcriptional regulator [Mesorhizobium sp.]RUV95764.1 GntR family transcriptional regulator [Mesorhizobium sp. M5C.F.Ca.IN.020.14.1.1]RWI32027.1 MAG: GntR family transcriptional regulator [Mesorhizobium sp.]RWI61351.1 MAG: GntR family transcriptional regulator [Mesorhizobium sp.]RWJ22854.1 MAG: GntR family transcriptional regulator [Mesorhizobium sp.]TIQ70098.1 MAG: GntR family transcriptional regulator [Mesorhizobium sp.]